MQNPPPEPVVNRLLTVPQSIGVLFQAVQIGQKAGAYTLQDSYTIKHALDSLRYRLNLNENMQTMGKTVHNGMQPPTVQRNLNPVQPVVQNIPKNSTPLPTTKSHSEALSVSSNEMQCNSSPGTTLMDQKRSLEAQKNLEAKQRMSAIQERSRLAESHNKIPLDPIPLLPRKSELESKESELESKENELENKESELERKETETNGNTTEE